MRKSRKSCNFYHYFNGRFWNQKCSLVINSMCLLVITITTCDIFQCLKANRYPIGCQSENSTFYEKRNEKSQIFTETIISPTICFAKLKSGFFCSPFLILASFNLFFCWNLKEVFKKLF